MAASGRAIPTLCTIALCATHVVAAQVRGTSPTAGATVSGVVYDSVAKAPLVNADVQLVAADDPARLGPTATSDAAGRYSLTDVPDGHYKLGFFHPALDSIGIDVPPRDVTVASHRAVHADLAIPAPARIRAAVCGKTAEGNEGALVLGVVRDANDGSPAAGVNVTGEWMEIAIDKGGMVRRQPSRTATTGDNGWFALCNVPSGGTMSLSASKGSDSTDRIEVEVPAEGFLRHELYIGSARTVVSATPTRPSDNVGAKPVRVHYGNGRVSGIVIAGASGKPLAGAQVSILGGPHVATNETGGFTITDAPMGTRMLEVRSLGYYPDRRRVDVVSVGPPVRIVLSTFRAVLDTVKIRARRLADRHDSGFEQRRRALAGKYLTAEDIERRGAYFTSDIFQRIVGVRAEKGDFIRVRGAFEEWCAASIYVDGHYMFEQSLDEIDAMMLPKDIAAIEVYTEATVPPQFQQGMSGCGSIVIWTK